MEVAAVESCDLGDVEPLRDLDDRGIGGAEREVSIGFDQLGHWLVVLDLEIDDRQGLLHDRAEKGGLDLGSGDPGE